MYLDRDLVKDNPVKLRLDKRVHQLLLDIHAFKGGQRASIARDIFLLGLNVAIATDPELESRFSKTKLEVANNGRIAA